MIIELCGIDGSGKGTVIELLSNEFPHMIEILNPLRDGLTVTELKKIAQKQDQSIYDLKANNLVSSSYLVDLLYMMERKMKEKTDKKIFLCDRYTTCLKVYSAIGKVEKKLVEILSEKAPKSDLIIYMDVEPQIALNRIHARGIKKTYKEKLEIMEKAKTLYQSHLEKIDNKSKFIINNDGNFEQLQVQVMPIIEEMRDEVIKKTI